MGRRRRQGEAPAERVLLRAVYGCFFDDPHGLQNLESVGEDNITFETDYPHTDSTWPETTEVAETSGEEPHRRAGLQGHPGQRDPHAATPARRRSADCAWRRGPQPSNDVDDLKRAAAVRAVDDEVRPGMVVGLGTGSTAIHATRRIGELVAAGELSGITGVPTAVETEAEARRVGIPLLTDEVPWQIDVTIDGADEVDPSLDLIKGGGGALLREKLVSQASAREVIVVDGSKCSERLGTRCALPVEVVDFGLATTRRAIEELGAHRRGAGRSRTVARSAPTRAT